MLVYLSIHQASSWGPFFEPHPHIRKTKQPQADIPRALPAKVSTLCCMPAPVRETLPRQPLGRCIGLWGVGGGDCLEACRRYRSSLSFPTLCFLQSPLPKMGETPKKRAGSKESRSSRQRGSERRFRQALSFLRIHVNFQKSTLPMEAERDLGQTTAICTMHLVHFSDCWAGLSSWNASVNNVG